MAASEKKKQNELRLVLGAKRATWRGEDEANAQADERFRAVKPKVFKRDQFKCKFCGFQSRKWQEVHHLDGDHSNHDPRNLATICSFCHMSFHIGRAGLAGEGELIWLPELSQTELNHLSRGCFVAMRTKGTTNEAGESIFSGLRIRAEEARRRLGTSDPADLGEALLAISEEAYEKRAEVLDGVRLLPLGRKYVGERDVFPKMVDFWVSRHGPFAKSRPKQWRAAASKLVKRIPTS
ncbi:MAG: type IVB secretion system protein IcmJDotN [Alphaproteobacteria bacterium]|nr:type IVB secretion system protein IcmJDotN [Alphaproteobacteria bacterium SS10]